MPLFAAAIFLSAFLLFQVQPVIARYILPWYGGSPSVWTACLLFFQAGLLGGYAYAHVLASLLKNRKAMQVGIHLSLLVCAFVFLPITPDESLKPNGGETSPALDIIHLLGFTVGVPYLLLSASGPLLQHWFGEAHPGRSPYRLYAVSNAGSMLGLLTYPFVVEPLLAVSRQTLLWSAGFVCYVAFAAACGAMLLKRRGSRPLQSAVGNAATDDDSSRPGISRMVLWIVLAACGSSLLLAITNQMCQDVSVVPFMWVAPLSLYLLTFVIAFDHERWYSRRVAMPLAVLAVAAAIWLIREDFREEELHLFWYLTIFPGAIFATCFVCHGELAKAKPAPRFLTGFYLAISFGGALGGLGVSLIAPAAFNSYWEFHLLLLGFLMLASGLMIRDVKGRSRRVLASVAATLVVVLAAIGLAGHVKETREDTLAASRSFYGTLRVHEYNVGTHNHCRVLLHGRITHGMQMMDERFRNLRTSYYGDSSGVGLAFDRQEAGLIRETVSVGAVGLGVGTIAAYLLQGDTIRFYEIDPDVETMARRHFTYLEDCKGQVEVVLGDARVTMEHELRTGGSRQYDILVVDAFSGDSVPLHLLTREAFALYFAHLKPEGILLIHISNHYLDLSHPIRRAASHFDYPAWRVDQEAIQPHEDDADWVLISRDGKLEAFLRDRDAITPWSREIPKTVEWSDDYANLLQVVKGRE